MRTIDIKPLYYGRTRNKVFLTLHELTYEHKGSRRPYYMVSRGEEVVPHTEKKPDAVVIVATLDNPGEIKRLVMTSEYRVPLGCRELSFPAGLIDAADYDGAKNIEGAACRAAIREMWEETGLDFEPKECSPPNLYSSGGMTNESVIYVFGTATGQTTSANCEASEDIEVILLEESEIPTIVNNKAPALAYSKTAWPILWGISKTGF